MVTFPSENYLIYPGCQAAIIAAGYGIAEVNGIWTVYGPGTNAENEAAVQAIIDSYNIKKELRTVMKLQINKEKVRRYYLLYPPLVTLNDQILEESHQDLFGNAVDLVLDLWGSINGTAKSANVSFQKILDLRAAAKTAITAVNNATTEAGILAVTVTWPV